MAVVNTITIVKSGGTYADVDEMRTAMRTAMAVSYTHLRAHET